MKYIKLSGALYLTGVQGGVTQFKPLGEWSEGRKSGFNTELLGQTGGTAWVKETLEEIEVLLISVDNKNT